WKTEKGVPLVLFAIPNEEKKRNDYAIEVPKLASFVLKHDFDAELQGLDAFGKNTPPVVPVFFAFRLMVGMGVAMRALSWFGFWRTRGGRAAPRWLLWLFAAFTFSGWIATLAGWIVTEMGRQPWIVTGVLRTDEAVGHISGAYLGASFMSYAITYAVMFIAYMVVLTYLAAKG